MGRLDGKVAIVTGAGRGIGRGIAIVLAREGAKVVVASRTPSTVDEVVAIIEGEGGVALGAPCDVGELQDLERTVEAAVRSFGTVDILVNNAQGFGTKANPLGTPPISPVETFSEAEWSYTLDTGPLATLRMMQLVFPYMKERGGKIINFGSLRGQVGTPHGVGYNAAKEAIRAVSRTAAREWGKHKINVNVVNPLVESASMEAARQRDAEGIKAFELGVPMGRFGDPIRDAGPLVAFLASSESDFLTGMTFMLDGGYLMLP
ncbi:MAG: SDR family oxidoreductase [Caulobacteraceae bacterium]|nr:SDR family oxidoreductase [Caulobacteraceae bacterium]